MNGNVRNLSASWLCLCWTFLWAIDQFLWIDLVPTHQQQLLLHNFQFLFSVTIQVQCCSFFTHFYHLKCSGPIIAMQIWASQWDHSIFTYSIHPCFDRPWIVSIVNCYKYLIQKVVEIQYSMDLRHSITVRFSK